MALVCTLGMFTACSDDDDKKEDVKVEGLEGKWNVQDVSIDPTTYLMKSSLVVNWEGDESATIDIPGVFDEPYAIKDAMTMLPMLGGQLREVLQDVTFQNGQILATYKDADDTAAGWQTATGYATYRGASDELIYVTVNADKATEGMDDDPETKALVSNILKKYNSIPVHIRWSNEKQTAFFYVDKEFVQPLLAELISMVSSMTPPADMDEEELAQYNILKTVAAQIPEIMQKTTKLEAGLELVK